MNRFLTTLCAVALILTVTVANAATLNRLHSSEIQTGNVIEADHINAEFNQLLNESNSQDTRLDTLEATVTSVNPVGSIVWYGGASAPTGYLFGYGQAVSRTTYSDLFAVYSTTYGSGDGSTTFNLPDCRGRVFIGKDDLGGSAASRITSSSTNGANSTTLGGAGGAQTHTLTSSEMPAHTHTYGGNLSQGTLAGNTIMATGGTAYTSGSTGGGGAHSNTQPWIALTCIIKT